MINKEFPISFIGSTRFTINKNLRLLCVFLLEVFVRGSHYQFYDNLDHTPKNLGFRVRFVIQVAVQVSLMLKSSEAIKFTAVNPKQYQHDLQEWEFYQCSNLYKPWSFLREDTTPAYLPDFIDGRAAV